MKEAISGKTLNFILVTAVMFGGIVHADDENDHRRNKVKSLNTSVLSVGSFLDGNQKTGFVGCSALNIGKSPVEVGLTIFRDNGQPLLATGFNLLPGESKSGGRGRPLSQTVYCEIKVFSGRSRGVRGTLTWFEENLDGTISPKVTTETR